MSHEVIIDNFAGGGGASTGIELALGRPVDAAINHDPQAIALHAANHPGTRHYCEDVFKVVPEEVAGGRPVGLAWFSPDCKDFSKAKGGKPRSKKIRGLAWVVIKWAARVKPRVIILENVEEFQGWGPLLPDGSRCPLRKGRTFKSWVKRLTGLGYAVEWREIRAFDYGAPTIRKRLYLIARCDGRPIVWPAATHGDPASAEVQSGKLLPWRTAAECIDWTLPCYSIFLTKREARKLRRDFGVKINRPLVKTTMRRVARGVFKFVLNAKEPFIVSLTHQGGDRNESCAEPIRTITGAHRGEKALVVPFVTEHANASDQRNMPADEPLRTQCAEVKGGHFAVAVPFLGKYNGSHAGKEDGINRNHGTDKPLMTLDTSNRFALVSAFLAKHYTGVVGSKLPTPIGTVTAVDHHSLVAANLTSFRAGNSGAAVGKPSPTITAGSSEKHPGGNGHAMGLVASHLSKFYGTTTGQETNSPLHSITSDGNHIAEVRAFLTKYYGEGGQDQDLNGPLHTIPTVDRFGLVTVEGQDYAISDICLRMLIARELYRCQGFPESYQIAITVEAVRRGKRMLVMLSNEAQVRMCGNSVSPPVAMALVAANVPELKKDRP